MNNIKRNISTKVIGTLIVFAAISFAAVAWAAYEHQTNNTNSVSVDVVPVQLGSGEKATFEIRLNTHTTPLDFDLVALSVLKDDQGREYHASLWNGSPAGGHHRSGVLEFPLLKGNPGSVTLVIQNIANVPERIFKWDLEH